MRASIIGTRAGLGLSGLARVVRDDMDIDTDKVDQAVLALLTEAGAQESQRLDWRTDLCLK